MTSPSSTPLEVLQSLRSELARAEKRERREKREAQAQTAAKDRPKAVKPQREKELEGIDLSAHSLSRAHERLRDAVLWSRFEVKAHAINHARAEGFLERDIIEVLMRGRVRAVYPEERRWLVCGYFEACRVKLPLHVVVEHHSDGWIDIVTAFVPKNPHHIISRQRLAVMLRYDDEQIRARTAVAGNKAGYRSKGRWK
ncbi:DUF4258 domain-containing protein [Deinococcus sp. Marseille-Q6407]|uniref:DUF4258 domain-containing protein n=1 Tax=Deinococcus sp. Marseille-Q6407 TaxID=2969223 RepID=UPI0021C20705|nr:DUF4258 domain-containing protein [Deinococcus sp. Marseille-Q6407]